MHVLSELFELIPICPLAITSDAQTFSTHSKLLGVVLGKSFCSASLGQVTEAEVLEEVPETRYPARHLIPQIGFVRVPRIMLASFSPVLVCF